MSQEENLNTDTNESVQVVPAALTIGQWLVQARQAKGLSAHEVSSRSNRSIKQIEAIEADDLSNFGSPNILRAVIRHYAKVIDADQDEAVRHLPADMQTLLSTPLASSLPSSSRLSEKMSSDGKLIKSPWISKVWLVLLALIVIGLLAYWVLFSRFLQKPESAQKITEANQVQVVAPPAVPAPVLVEPAAATPVVAADELKLKFNVSSWVEIKDAKGVVLLSGEQKAGTESSGLTGELPLKVKIGNASNVEATWKGQPLDLKTAITNKSTDLAKIEELK